MNYSSNSFAASVFFSVLTLGSVQQVTAHDTAKNNYLLPIGDLPSKIESRSDYAFVKWFIESYIPSCRKQHQGQQNLIREEEKKELAALTSAFELFFRACEQSEEECVYVAKDLNQKREDLRTLALHASLIAQNHGPINRAEERAKALLLEYESLQQQAADRVQDCNDTDESIANTAVEELLEESKTGESLNLSPKEL